MTFGYVSGQKSEIYPEKNYVIAQGGLRLRSEPRKHSKVLTLIPFGDTVKYISRQVFASDSLQVPGTYEDDQLLSL